MFPAGRSNDLFQRWFKNPRGVKILNGQRSIKHCRVESATESNTINGYQRAMLSAMWLIYFWVWDKRNSQSVAGGSPQPLCLISTAAWMLLSSPTSKTTTLVNCLSGVYGRMMLFCAKMKCDCTLCQCSVQYIVLLKEEVQYIVLHQCDVQYNCFIVLWFIFAYVMHRTLLFMPN